MQLYKLDSTILFSQQNMMASILLRVKKSTYLSRSTFVVVLNLRTHADLADEWGMFLTELYQHQFAVPTAQVLGRSHEEHVTTARS